MSLLNAALNQYTSSSVTDSQAESNLQLFAKHFKGVEIREKGKGTKRKLDINTKDSKNKSECKKCSDCSPDIQISTVCSFDVSTYMRTYAKECKAEFSHAKDSIKFDDTGTELCPVDITTVKEHGRSKSQELTFEECSKCILHPSVIKTIGDVISKRFHSAIK